MWINPYINYYLYVIVKSVAVLVEVGNHQEPTCFTKNIRNSNGFYWEGSHFTNQDSKLSPVIAKGVGGGGREETSHQRFKKRSSKCSSDRHHHSHSIAGDTITSSRSKIWRSQPRSSHGSTDSGFLFCVSSQCQLHCALPDWHDSMALL